MLSKLTKTSRVNYLALSLMAATMMLMAATARVTIPAGTDVLVRVDEAINSKNADEGRVYAAHLDQDLLDSNANPAVRKGAPAEVLVRRVVSGKDLVLDLQALSVDGRASLPLKRRARKIARRALRKMALWRA